MATIKIIPIKADLNACIEYAVNAEKTQAFGHLANSLGYIADGDKTAEARFVSAMKCSPDTAFDSMRETKREHGKQNAKRQGFHLIQSFEPGEVTPELAHRLGRELAEKMLGKYEVVIATHIDKNHIHNHIVFNSVSFADGKAFGNSKDDLRRIREASDALCREYELSTVRPGRGYSKGKIEYTDLYTGERVLKDAKGKSRSRTAWDAETERRPVLWDKVRGDVDRIVASYSTTDWAAFEANLRKLGYKIRKAKDGSELKHYTVITPSGTRVRFDRLGDDYSPERIRERITEARKNGIRLPSVPTPKVRHAQLRGSYTARPKLRGFKALYFRYLYALGKVPAQQSHRASRTETRTARYLAPELKKLNRVVEQEKFLREWKLNTYADLSMFTGAVGDEIFRLERLRQPLYNERRKSTITPEDRADIDAMLARINAQLRERRVQLTMCKRIDEESREMAAKLEAAKEFAREEQEKKPERSEKVQDKQPRDTRYK